MKFKPYSFSKISTYNECPQIFQYKYIEKLKICVDPRFFEKGNFYHKVLENYPNKDVNFKFKYADEKTSDIYIKNIRDFIEMEHVQDLLHNRFVAELEFKFNESLKPTDISKWKSGLYGYIDYVGKIDDTIYIVDWKSKDHGDKYPTNPKQLEMYAAWLFLIRPKCQKIIAEFAYIENQTFTQFKYTRDDVADFISDISNNINNIENDNTFNKNVSKSCTKCDYFNKCKPFNIKRNKD